MSYIETEKINVFPSARRVGTQASSRLLNEYSVARIINKLVDMDGFVITDYDSNSSTAPSNPFEFNIHGYYFKVSSAKAIFDLFDNYNTTVKSIYANIILDDSINNYVELLGQDDEDVEHLKSVYEGVQFTTWPIQPTEERPLVYSLQLFGRESATSPWAVPSSSRVKYNSNSIDFDIDGGEI